MILKTGRIFLASLLIVGIVNGQTIDKIYLSESDSTSNLYLAVQPEVPLQGFLILVPGFGEIPEGAMAQSDIPKVAAQQGILTIIPTFKTGVTSFGVDDATQASFREILADAAERYNIPSKTKMYVGGFSIGGTCAVKFAELVSKNDYENQPAAVFAIDPPLDFERFYYSARRSIRLSVNNEPSQEAVYMIGRIEKEMGGTPDNALSAFYKYSPYSFSDSTQSAIKPLINTPIRIYTEPDVNWWISERGSDYSTMNALDASAMINELRRLGNDKATLITTTNKGYRKYTNQRHPHSWSIVDSSELVNWLLKK